MTDISIHPPWNSRDEAEPWFTPADTETTAECSYRGGAVFSSCGTYRYLLWRRWNKNPMVTWIMLNPSTADARQDDPTIRRCRDFSIRWGLRSQPVLRDPCGGIVVVNLFAYRATNPKELVSAAREGCDIIGPENDRYVALAAEQIGLRQKGIVVCAWGARGQLLGRDMDVEALITPWCVPYILGLTKHKQPRHPLYMSRRTRPVIWDDSEERRVRAHEEAHRLLRERSEVKP